VYPDSVPSVKATLVKELNLNFGCLSPDGSLLCGGTRSIWGGLGRELRVVQMGSWKTVYSLRLGNNIAAAEFFADGQSLYLETDGTRNNGKVIRHVFVDLRNGHTEEHRTVGLGGMSFRPLGDQMLLGVQYHFPERSEDWVLVSLPDYREVRRAFWEKASGYVPISPDRKRLAHLAGRTVTCYRTDDLSVLWSREIDLLDGRGGVGLGFSANSNWVTAAVRLYLPGEHLVSILAAADGTPFARLPWANRGEVSPNGTLLVVPETHMEIGSSNVMHLTTQIYEVSSGRLLASLLHYRLHLGHTAPGPGSAFTPDGKYLVTAVSGTPTKVWRLDPQPILPENALP
jgi:hypothetical protein